MSTLRRYLFSLFALVATCSFLLTYLPSDAQAFDASNLASDSVFENTSSMSPGQIDSFLNTYTSSCISNNNHFTTPDPHGYSSTQNQYVFGSNVSGGQAIYDIAQNYHVSPQVILTTLQKEQSIVTGGAGCYPNTPDPSTAANSPCGSAKTPCTQACPYSGGCMTIAMSYACPNYCYAGIEGFNYQLSGGTWLLRFAEERAYGTLTGYTGYDSGDEAYSYSGPMTPGFRQRVQGGANVYYDGSWTTSDGTSVSITDGATASLYTYTPFVSGNQNFVNLFQTTFGFGSTTSGGCVGTEPELPYVVRYYNPRTYEHFYTAYACDQNFLNNIGFIREGAVFNTTDCTNPLATPVYRYYNPKTGLHMWSTDDVTEAQLDAGTTGYHVEAGQVFCVDSSSDPSGHPIYRFYNPRTYLHAWGSPPTQADLPILNQAGYTDIEGTAFYTQ